MAIPISSFPLQTAPKNPKPAQSFAKQPQKDRDAKFAIRRHV